jgi:hypothetical protein
MISSTFNDLILSGLVGLWPSADGRLTVNPLVPTDALPWWCDTMLASQPASQPASQLASQHYGSATLRDVLVLVLVLVLELVAWHGLTSARSQ